MFICPIPQPVQLEALGLTRVQLVRVAIVMYIKSVDNVQRLEMPSESLESLYMLDKSKDQSCNGAHPLRELNARVTCTRQAYTGKPRKR